MGSQIKNNFELTEKKIKKKKKKQQGINWYIKK